MKRSIRDLRAGANGIPLLALGLGCLLVFVGALALYLPNVRHEFVFDDHNMIENNERIWSLRNWHELLTTPWWGRDRNNGLYRPVTMLTYAVDFELGRLSPFVYHLWNDVLHGLNSALVLILTWLSFRSLSAALIAAGLFALHPIHGESVHWVVGRPELLAALFTMLALGVVQTSVVSRNGRAWVAAGLAAACCLLAILSKENGIVAFAALPLAVVLIGDREAGDAPSWSALWSARARLLWGLLGAAGLIWIALRQNAIRENLLPVPEADNPLAHVSALDRICTALSVVPVWLGKLVLPSSLSVDYGPPRIPVLDFPGSFQTWLGAALLAGLLASLWICRRRAPAVAFWVGFMLLAYLPTSNLLIPVGVVFSERALYMPSIASCALLGFGFSRIRLPWLGQAAASLLAVAYLTMSVQRTGDWRDDITLFRHEMQFQPPAMRSQKNYAKLIEKTDPERAEAIYRDVVSRNPGYAEARLGYGTFLLGKRNPAGALEQLEEAHRLKPDDPQALLNLGAAYAGVLQWDRAVDCWERVLEIDPRNQVARGNLEEVRRALGR